MGKIDYNVAKIGLLFTKTQNCRVRRRQLTRRLASQPVLNPIPTRLTFHLRCALFSSTFLKHFLMYAPTFSQIVHRCNISVFLCSIGLWFVMPLKALSWDILTLVGYVKIVLLLVRKVDNRQSRRKYSGRFLILWRNFFWVHPLRFQK